MQQCVNLQLETGHNHHEVRSLPGWFSLRQITHSLRDMGKSWKILSLSGTISCVCNTTATERERERWYNYVYIFFIDSFIYWFICKYFSLSLLVYLFIYFCCFFYNVTVTTSSVITACGNYPNLVAATGSRFQSIWIDHICLVIPWCW